MTEKDYVTITPNGFYGYINEDTACGKAKAKQIKADMETLTTMLQDTHLSPATKKAIYTDYTKAIREYVERKETCCGCPNNCDYECEEEEFDIEEEEENLAIEDMDSFTISTDSGAIECDCYEDTVHKVKLLEELGISYDVYAYDNDGNEYPCDVIHSGYDISLEIAD